MPAVSPLHLPGSTLTGRASGAAITGGRFVKIVGPAVVPFPNGDPPKIAHATAATDAVIGVALYDAADGKTTTFAAIGNVVPVEASAAITAGTFVTVTTAGKAVTVSGRATAVGIAWTTSTADGDFIFVQLV